jgi:hypothetical protein
MISLARMSWLLGHPWVKLALSFLVLLTFPDLLVAQSQQQRDDWELNLVLLHNAIEVEHPMLPKNPRDVQSYLEALEIDAKDRELAYKYAQEAQAAKNDFYFNKFMELAGRAQNNGDEVLMKANIDAYVLAEGECEGYHCWVEWGFRSQNNGIPLFQKAPTLSFNQEITRGQVRYLMNLAMDKMESQGPWVEGEPAPRPDPELKDIDRMVRSTCLSFQLQAEYDRATEIMNRYLIEVLCRLSSLGHQYFLDQANQYKLERAKSYIEGFYAFVMGKVEVDRGDGPKPARGATVKVIDPHDDREWSATADNSGDYVMEKVILHKKCSTFRIIAEFEGEKKEESIEGPLEKPDPAYWFEKNFLFKKTPPGSGHGNFLYKETINQKYPDVGDGGPGSYYNYTETATGQVFFDSYRNGRFRGKATIHYSRQSELNVDLKLVTITEEGTDTVECILDYVWGSPRPAYSFEAEKIRVQRDETIVHKPFGGRGEWKETNNETVSRDVQTGHIHAYGGFERYALSLSGSVDRSAKDGEMLCNWNFQLRKPKDK